MCAARLRPINYYGIYEIFFAIPRAARARVSALFRSNLSVVNATGIYGFCYSDDYSREKSDLKQSEREQERERDNRDAPYFRHLKQTKRKATILITTLYCKI